MNSSAGRSGGDGQVVDDGLLGDGIGGRSGGPMLASGDSIETPHPATHIVHGLLKEAVGSGYGVNITCKKYGVVLGAASLLT